VPNPVKHQAHFGSSVYEWHFFGWHFSAYIGLIAFCINLAVVVVASLLLGLLRAPKGEDRTAPADFEAVAAPALPSPVGTPPPRAA